jgi:hypothetical protein
MLSETANLSPPSSTTSPHFRHVRHDSRLYLQTKTSRGIKTARRVHPSTRSLPATGHADPSRKDVGSFKPNDATALGDQSVDIVTQNVESTPPCRCLPDLQPRWPGSVTIAVNLASLARIALDEALRRHQVTNKVLERSIASSVLTMIHLKVCRSSALTTHWRVSHLLGSPSIVLTTNSGYGHHGRCQHGDD